MNQALKDLLDYMEQQVRQHYIHENSPLGHLFMQYKRSTLPEIKEPDKYMIAKEVWAEYIDQMPGNKYDGEFIPWCCARRGCLGLLGTLSNTHH